MRAGRRGGTLGIARIDLTPAPKMRDTQLLQLALGINPPWFVGSSDFDAEKNRLDIEVDFKAESPLRLPRLQGR